MASHHQFPYILSNAEGGIIAGWQHQAEHKIPQRHDIPFLEPSTSAIKFGSFPGDLTLKFLGHNALSPNKVQGCEAGHYFCQRGNFSFAVDVEFV